MERVNPIFSALVIKDTNKENQNSLRSLSNRVSTMAAAPSTISRPQPDIARGYSTTELPTKPRKPRSTVSKWL